MVGHVARKSNDRGMAGVVCNGLRDDYDEKGKQQGRVAIMADPWGAADKCENLYLQRGRGNVRIVIAMDVHCDGHTSQSVRGNRDALSN
jgi:hypothetical protein